MQGYEVTMLSSCLFQAFNYLNDFHNFCYEPYAIWGHIKLVHLNFLQWMIATWRIRKNCEGSDTRATWCWVVKWCVVIDLRKIWNFWGAHEPSSVLLLYYKFTWPWCDINSSKFVVGFVSSLYIPGNIQIAFAGLLESLVESVNE